MSQYLFTLAIACFSIAFPVSAFAATFSLQFEREDPNGLIAHVVLDTESETINALEGVLEYPVSALVLTEVSDGNSRINLWVEKPHEQQFGSVVFSGMTPGGFSHDKAHLFTLRFTKKHSEGEFTFPQAHAFRNDGNATPVAVTASPISIPGDDMTPPVTDAAHSDEESPEALELSLLSDPDVYEGKHVLIFATQDKDSGIRVYRVREGRFGIYRDAESPYLLRDQSLSRDVYVKAIDYAGNERVSVLSAQNPQKWRKEHLLFGILGVFALLLLFVRVRTWFVSTHSS